MIYTQEDALRNLIDFSKRNPEEFGITIDKLNENEFVTYFDGADFSVKIAEHWSKKCSDYMKECGYNGQELYAFAKYYEENTPGRECSEFLYILYGSELYEGDRNEKMQEAKKFLNSEFNDWLKGISDS